MRAEEVIPPAIVKSAPSMEEEYALRICSREETIGKNIVDHAIAQGRDLLAVQQRLGKRKFHPWLKAHVPFTRNTAYSYMRVAEQQEVICNARVQITSLRQAIKMLSGTKNAKNRPEACPLPEFDPNWEEHADKDSTEPERAPVTAASEKSERPSDQDQSTPAARQKEKLDEKASELDEAEDEGQPDNKAAKESLHDRPRAKSEGAVGTSEYAVVILIVDPENWTTS